MEQKEKILIVDDESTNLEFFEVMLSNLGFDIVQAEDGEKALEKIKKSSPDLILLDNIMPGITGWELTKILKTDPDYSDFKDIPIIMFSAMDDVKDKIEGFQLGIQDYITKPYNFSEVLARIQAVLRQKELAGQVIQRERRLTLMESLEKSLLYFTDHVRQPIEKLLENSRTIKADDQNSVKAFLKDVKKECGETLAAIEGLQDEINEMKIKNDELVKSQLSLEDLENKFKKRLEAGSRAEI